MRPQSCRSGNLLYKNTLLQGLSFDTKGEKCFLIFRKCWLPKLCRPHKLAPLSISNPIFHPYHPSSINCPWSLSLVSVHPPLFHLFYVLLLFCPWLFIPVCLYLLFLMPRIINLCCWLWGVLGNLEILKSLSNTSWTNKNVNKDTHMDMQSNYSHTVFTSRLRMKSLDHIPVCCGCEEGQSIHLTETNLGDACSGNGP